MFDFDAYLDNFRRLPRWRVVRVSARSSQRFSAYAVLGINKYADIKKKTMRFRYLWSDMLHNLASRRLWYFYRDEPEAVEPLVFDFQKFGLSFRRCVCCRPSYLFFRSRKFDASVRLRVNHQLRPCRRRACPFCFARRVQWSFLFVKKRLNAFLAKSPDRTTKKCLIYRSYTEHVPAAGFSGVTGLDKNEVIAFSNLLRARMHLHRKVYDNAKRSFSRRVAGGLWGLYVWPVSDGWVIETRQFLLTTVGKKLPELKFPFKVSKQYRRVLVKRSPKDLRDFDDKFERLFGLFWRYPKGLLIGYPELVAAVFWAMTGFRTTRSFGVFSGGTMRSHREAEIRGCELDFSEKSVVAIGEE